jgi:hypothetical protein
MSSLAQGFPVRFINSTFAQQLMEDAVLLCNNLQSFCAKKSTIATRQTMLSIPLQGQTTTIFMGERTQQQMGQYTFHSWRPLQLQLQEPHLLPFLQAQSQQVMHIGSNSSCEKKDSIAC